MYERVLLADDAPFMRMMQKSILEDNGFKVCGEAKDGLEALEKYEELEPDVLILGLVLPKLDGLEVLRKIKKEYPAAKIIICSSMVRENYVINALKYGACDFIAKPFKPENLVSEIKAAIENTRLAALLGEKTLSEWYGKQQNYGPDENLTQEQIDVIVESYNQLYIKK